MASPPILCCFSLSALVCLAIGLPTYLMGCNDRFYPTGCVAYRIEPKATVDAHYVSSSESCVVYMTVNDIQMCTVWETVYGGSVHFVVGCQYGLDNLYKSEDGARNALINNYPIGSTHLVYIERARPDTCSANSKRVTNDLPITGITFLTLTGVFLLALIVACISCTSCKSASRPEIV